MKFPMDPSPSPSEVSVVVSDKELTAYKEKKILFNTDENKDLTILFPLIKLLRTIWKTT